VVVGAILACASNTAGQIFAVSVVNSASVVIVAEPKTPIVGPVKIGVADEYTTVGKDPGTPGVFVGGLTCPSGGS
jgi:hypothetical protein